MVDTQKRFGSWIVDELGNMESEKDSFFISSDRLIESDWWQFVLSVRNIDLNDFLPAYFYACKVAGIGKVEINMTL